MAPIIHASVELIRAMQGIALRWRRSEYKRVDSFHIVNFYRQPDEMVAACSTGTRTQTRPVHMLAYAANNRRDDQMVRIEDTGT